MSDVNQPVALVTGANKGLGFEISRQLAQKGIRVFMSARDPERAAAAAKRLLAEGLTVEPLWLDLNNAASISAAADTLRATQGKLDILINNAGIVDERDGPPTVASTDAVRHIMETNFTGTLAVTQAMLPLLKQAPAARIVNLSSSLGSLTLNGDPGSTYYSARLMGYNASKAALNMLTVQLAQELRGTSVVINSVSPGYVKTDLNGHNGVMTVEEGAKLPVEYALLGENAVSGQFIEPAGLSPW